MIDFFLDHPSYKYKNGVCMTQKYKTVLLAFFIALWVGMGVIVLSQLNWSVITSFVSRDILTFKKFDELGWEDCFIQWFFLPVCCAFFLSFTGPLFSLSRFLRSLAIMLVPFLSLFFLVSSLFTSQAHYYLSIRGQVYAYTIFSLLLVCCLLLQAFIEFWVHQKGARRIFKVFKNIILCILVFAYGLIIIEQLGYYFTTSSSLYYVSNNEFIYLLDRYSATLAQFLFVLGGGGLYLFVSFFTRDVWPQTDRINFRYKLFSRVAFKYIVGIVKLLLLVLAAYISIVKMDNSLIWRIVQIASFTLFAAIVVRGMQKEVVIARSILSHIFYLFCLPFCFYLYFGGSLIRWGGDFYWQTFPLIVPACSWYVVCDLILDLVPLRRVLFPR